MWKGFHSTYFWTIIGAGKKNATFEQTFDERDISIRYTVDNDEMMIDLEQQALVS